MENSFSENPRFASVSTTEIADTFNLTYTVTLPNEQLDPLVHYHDCFELVFYVSADIQAYIDEAHYHLTSKDVLIIPPRKMHKIIYPEHQSYVRYVLYFSQEHIESFFGPGMAAGAIHLFKDRPYRKVSLSVPEYMRINNLFQNMYEHRRTLASQNFTLLNAYSSLILQELYHIFDRRPSSPPEAGEMSPVDQILKYINSHYSEAITLETLAEEFYLNRSYICRLFRKTMGISVINYLQHKRILEAQQMLLNSSRSIIDISMECGFSNIQHFYRVFKKITTLTPAEYKNHQSANELEQKSN